jgi:hypothetical protein
MPLDVVLGHVGCSPMKRARRVHRQAVTVTEDVVTEDMVTEDMVTEDMVTEDMHVDRRSLRKRTR